MKNIDAYLSDLEDRIDPIEEERLFNEWVDFLEGRFTGVIFSPRRTEMRPSKLEWQVVSINEALDDFDTMILQQYGACSLMLAGGSGGIMNVRCNYGSSIIPVLFGAELYIMDEEFNTLPTSRPLPGDIDTVRKLIDDGVPKLRASIAGKVFEMGERYRQIGEGYPKIGKYIPIYHPDVQGPLDICEVVIGSGIFYMLYDHPELIKQFLGVVTQTYIEYMREWYALIPPQSAYSAHWSMLHKGYVMLRDDSAMNLSPDMYLEFVRPYDQMIFDGFGGGAIHFCGRGDHYIEQMCQMNGLTAIAMSQPHLNNMETIYRNTIDKGISLIGFDRGHAEKALESGKGLHGLVHCF
ncbi:MAG: hypothetical protein ACYC0V_10820 [Armatimonadota bacterium]